MENQDLKTLLNKMEEYDDCKTDQDLLLHCLSIIYGYNYSSMNSEKVIALLKTKNI